MFKKHNGLISVFFLLALSPFVWAEEDHVETSLFSETQSIQPGRPFWVGLKMKMDPHWHTYWRNPGDSGLPTTLEWNLPPGFKAGEIQWPYPSRIEVPPLVSYGYENETLLLVQIHPSKDIKSETVKLNVKASWLECKEICLPGEAEENLELDVKDEFPVPNSKMAELFSTYRFKLPISDSDWNFSANQNENFLQISLTPYSELNNEIKNLYFYPYDAGIVDYSLPQKMGRTDTGWAIEIPKSDLLENPVKNLKGILVSEDGWRGPNSEKSIYIDLTVNEGSYFPVKHPQASESTPSHPLIVILLLAFVGGLILNLMPCVLPVLSIKLLGFVQQKELGRKELITHTSIFSLGIITAFWVLAAIILILKETGQQLGWGFQLQSPYFVSFLVVLFYLLALSMFGVFEIGVSLISLADKNKKGPGYSSSFFNGILATLVATPCTAPFMGAALGAALVLGVLPNIFIFTALGLGMSLPYLAVGWFPKILAIIPKPGAWMNTFKKIMGLMFLGTVLWLLWVLSIQITFKGLIWIILGLALLLISSWLYGKSKFGWDNDSGKKIAAVILSILSLVILYLGIKLKGTNTGDINSSVITSLWEPYDASRVKAEVEQGNPVFIDFTAAWCLTCQVNKKLVLETNKVTKKFDENGFVLFRGDWTNRSDVITQALQKYGRSGVPTYVLYSKDGEVQILPEVLTTSLMLKKIDDSK